MHLLPLSCLRSSNGFDPIAGASSPKSWMPLVNLKKLILDSSYRLKEIPNLSNATNLETLSLSSCSSLVELPSSIGNLHKLEKLIMRSCKKLRVIPTNINLASLEEVHMSYCSQLKTFPEFSSSIWYLAVRDTKIEDVPASLVGRWSRCRGLDVGSKSLKRLINIRLSVTKLDLINSDIKRIPECITGLPQLEYLIVENCTNLVSIPALPPSLKSLNANNCLSLKTVHCSFHSPLKELTFYNCLKLDEEARRGIIQQPVYKYICLPGKEVPSEFSHRATGNSITISEATFAASSRFKVCFLVSPIEDCGFITIGCCLTSKEGVVINSFFSEARVYELSPLSEHLFILHCERRNRRHDVATSEITFEFRCVYNDEKIIECGVHVLAEAAESSSNSEVDNFETGSSSSGVDNIQLGSNSCEVDGDYEAEAFMEMALSLIRDFRLLVCPDSDILWKGDASSVRNVSSNSVCHRATNLETLSLSSCSSLVELPSSVRNLHKLEKLIMRSCKKLRVIPTNINLASLEEVHMSYCSQLKTFPEFSSSIWYLAVRDTKIEDVPASVVGRWSRCRGLDIGSKSLKRLTNIPLSVTKLDLINSDIKRIQECITGLPQLEYLIVENCTNLVSIPALPPSLKSLNANNCLSLKTVHCSFHSPLKELTFYNCVKLDEEARRGIIQQPVYQYICLPAKEVPSEFTHRATGNSITISEASFSASSRFKVCFLVSPIEDCGFITIGCCLRSKEGVVINSFFSEARVYELSPLSEHLFIHHCERRNRRHDVATSEITFEFSCVYNDEKIIECGVHVLAEAAESSSNREMDNFEFESSNSEVDNFETGSSSSGVDNIELGSNSCEVDGDYEAEAFMVSQGENIKTSKNTRWSWLQKLGLKKKMNKTKQTS
ncbi:hypothetical protein F2Q70_00027439 [Brassica cretica]|uniref:Uncharacterized protein n=1 Tax=Brassica cretica TaxID=69181 RepID=A0A8S9LFD9_BRACR|nr:hypothetical protein F2Q70_00027439 [Brassica cretica]